MDWLWGIPTGHMDEDTVWRARERVEPVVSLSRGPFCNSCGSPTQFLIRRWASETPGWRRFPLPLDEHSFFQASGTFLLFFFGVRASRGTRRKN